MDEEAFREMRGDIKELLRNQIEAMQHAAQCDESRKHIEQDVKENKSIIKGLDKRLSNLSMKVIGIGAAVAAGGAGVFEVVKAILGE